MSGLRRFVFRICSEDEDERLDNVLVKSLKDLKDINEEDLCYNITRSEIQVLIKDKNVLLNGLPVKKNKRVKMGDEITVVFPESRILDVLPENIPLNIAYEDKDIIVVNKPKGMVVHPASGNYKGTLVNALLFYLGDSLSGINGVLRPGIVHRIDKNTSGLLIVAKNDFAHKKLAEKIKVHDFLREYEAVVYGKVKNENGTIVAPIGRNKNNRKQMSVTSFNGKEAITHYRLLGWYVNSKGQFFSHVRLKLETGRTHQIRVHMAYIGHPLAGDDVYGPKTIIKSLNGQCLHARTIGFEHPRTGEFIKIESDLPEYFKNFLTKLTRYQ